MTREYFENNSAEEEEEMNNNNEEEFEPSNTDMENEELAQNYRRILQYDFQ